MQHGVFPLIVNRAVRSASSRGESLAGLLVEAYLSHTTKAIGDATRDETEADLRGFAVLRSLLTDSSGDPTRDEHYYDGMEC